MCYYRYSTAKQHSIEEQRRECRRYAQEQGWAVVYESQDAGISAWKHGREGRAGLDSLLVEAERGHLRNGVVLVYDLDRMSRDFAVGYSDILALNRLDVAIADTKHGLYSQTSLEGILLTVLTLHRAQQESEVKSRRVSAAFAKRREAGLWVGKPPFGYRRIAVDGGTNLEIIEDEAEGIREAYTMLVAGHTQAEVGRMLKAKHPKHKWWATSVTRLLSNPTYAGYQPTGQRLVKGKHPPIITEGLFFQAQPLVKQKGGSRTAHSKRPLTGLVLCPHCGEKMITSAVSAPNGGRYIRCRKAILKLGCPCRNIQEATVNAVVMEYLRALEAATREDTAVSKLDRAEGMAEELAALTARQERLIEAAQYAGDIRAIAAKIRDIEGQIAQLTADIERAKTKEVDDMSAIVAADEPPANIRQVIDEIRPSLDWKTWTIKSRFGNAEVTTD
jgi:DNA invertase Pin-like site-specific DNA recombinase